MFGEASPLHPELIPLMRESGVMYRRSTERAMRALASLFANDRAVAAADLRQPPAKASAPVDGGDLGDGLSVSIAAGSHGGWGPVVKVTPVGGWAAAMPAFPVMAADLTAAQAADILAHSKAAGGLTPDQIQALGEMISKAGAAVRTA
jgi:hypothetical protein